VKRPFALIVGIATLMAGCGGGSNMIVPPPLQVHVTISPVSASVPTGTMLQFKASVSNTTNTAVTWKVNNTTGGSAATGTISNSGLFTAPATVPNPATVTVTAVAEADTSASASSAVTITEGTTVSISPSSATVLAGATQQFTSTVNGQNGAVTWQVNGVTGGAPATGTVSTSGLYTAPAIPPSGQDVTVTAVSQADPTMSASAAVTVAPSVGTLKGQYAFSFNGTDTLGTLMEAGYVTADGKGNITGGNEDVNSGAGIFTNVPLTGTYTVGQDGRASLTLTRPGATGLGTETFDAVLITASHARLIGFSNVTAGAGNLDLQDSTAFSKSSLQGNYVLNLDGIDGNAGPLSAIALLDLDGSGNVTSGALDLNDNGGVSQGNGFNGSYAVASNGRGTMTITGTFGTFDFAFYVVSAGTLRVMSVDPTPVWTGTAAGQQGSNFNNASLKGPFVFAASGVNAGGALDDAGQFSSGGAGSITAGTGDENSDGVTATGVAITGTYSVDSTGHGDLTLNYAVAQGSQVPAPSVHYSFYLQSASRAVLLGIDTISVTSGAALAQSSALFTPDMLAGPYGFSVDGVYSGGPLDKLGQFTADGTSAASGVEDVNGAGALTTGLTLTATYTLKPNGRGTLSVTAGGSTRTLNIYLASPGEVFLLGLDADQVVLGLAEQQFK